MHGGPAAEDAVQLQARGAGAAVLAHGGLVMGLEQNGSLNGAVERAGPLYQQG